MKSFHTIVETDEDQFSIQATKDKQGIYQYTGWNPKMEILENVGLKKPEKLDTGSLNLYPKKTSTHSLPVL